MKNRSKIIAILNFAAAILFFLSAIIGKNNVYIPIGCCFIALGIVNGRSNDKK